MEKTEVDNLIKLVDEFVSSLKKELLAIEVPSKGVLPGMWDKIKNWWYSITKGKNNPENPYMYQHKFGALGEKQESKRLSLSQYKFIKECYEDLENSLNILTEETAEDSDHIRKLKLFKIIDSWSERFKKAILNQFGVKTKDQSKSSTTTTATTATKPEDSSQNVGGWTPVNAGVEDEMPGLPPASAMSKVPNREKTPTSAPTPIIAGERAGAGRVSPLVINWSDKKKKLIVRDKIEGKAIVRELLLGEILPISELVKTNVKNVKAAAENNLKLSVYRKLISQLPGTDRQATGSDEDPIVFEIDKDIFDEKFIIALKEIIKEYSAELAGQGKTTGNKLHKKIIKDIYYKLDGDFSERADDWASKNTKEDIDLILNPPKN